MLSKYPGLSAYCLSELSSSVSFSVSSMISSIQWSALYMRTLLQIKKAKQGTFSDFNGLFCVRILMLASEEFIPLLSKSTFSALCILSDHSRSMLGSSKKYTVYLEDLGRKLSLVLLHTQHMHIQHTNTHTIR